MLGFSVGLLFLLVNFANEDLLVLKSTESQSHGGHVSATGSSLIWSAISDCRPDYMAAFMNNWGGKNATLWSCIRLVGEKASHGISCEDQKRQAMSSLHCLCSVWGAGEFRKGEIWETQEVSQTTDDGHVPCV